MFVCVLTSILLCFMAKCQKHLLCRILGTNAWKTFRVANSDLTRTDSKLPATATVFFFFITISCRLRLRNFSSSFPRSVSFCTLCTHQNKAGTYSCALDFFLGILNSAVTALSSRSRPYIFSVQFVPFRFARTAYGSWLLFQFTDNRPLRETLRFTWYSVFLVCSICYLFL